MAGEIITLTERAVDRVGQLMEMNPDAAGLRIWIKEGGCNGLTYQVDLAEAEPVGDDVVETAQGKVFVDPKAAMYVLGSEMDFYQDKFYSGFLFKNPNESGRCGCGESFSVEKDG